MKLLYPLLSGVAPIAVLAMPMAAYAQTANSAPPQGADDVELYSDGDNIVVTGERLRGQVQVEQAPILELDEADIAGIGANSIAEILQVIAPQTTSSRRRSGGGGGPAILVNGLRISSFRELRSYPPEAIRKVEVLPEEVAVKFGFSADQRVVNLILKDNFSSREIEFEYEGPSEGGYLAREAEFTLLKLDKGKRLNITAEVRDTSLLDESERDIIQTEGSTSSVATDPDPAQFRSLVDDSLDIEATINWTSSNLDNGSLLSLNGTYEREESTRLSGLNSVTLTDPNGNEAFRLFGEDTPLRRRVSSDSFSAGSTYTRPMGLFQFTATADAAWAETETLIDNAFDTQALVDAAAAGDLALDGALPTNADAGFDTANNRSLTSDNQITLRGSPLMLPAGEVSTTFDAGFDWKRIESADTRTAADIKLTRSRWEVGANVSVPIAERGGAWGAIGDVSVSFSAGLEELSDFGTLIDANAGLNWGVADGLDLSANYIYTEVAPSLTQLGSPEIQTLNVPVFDFVNGETVLATVTTGGNANLQAETQKDWKFAANWQFPLIDNSRLTVEYIRNRSSNVTSSFPSITQAIEAAFPDRIARDSGGQLIAVDQRPITFESTRSKRLVFGFTTRGSFGKASARGGPPGRGGRDNAARAGRPPGQGPKPTVDAKTESAQTGSAKPDAVAPRGGNRASQIATRGGSRGFGRDGRGRYFVNLTHSVELDNTILIAANTPILDQLNGDTTQTLGFPRHTSSMRAGVFRKGKGLRVTADYTGSAHVNGSGLPGSSDLSIDDLLTIDLRLFVNLGEVLNKPDTFLDDLRLAFRADNVFNARRNVRDGNGDVPLAFQPGLLDPTGRFIGMDIRKIF